jgi:hypothetical protein
MMQRHLFCEQGQQLLMVQVAISVRVCMCAQLPVSDIAYVFSKGCRHDMQPLSSQHVQSGAVGLHVVSSNTNYLIGSRLAAFDTVCIPYW